MIGQDQWRPTKFVERGGRLRASADPDQVARASRLTADRAAAAYQQLLVDHARGDLLDLGAGQVPLYGVYRRLVDSVICADWPQTGHGARHLDVFVDASRSLPFRDRSFDTVLMTDVLEHLPKPDVLWAEVARLLRPGGRLLIGVPFMYWIHESPNDHHRYTEHRLRLFAGEHGFDVTALWAYGDALDVLVDSGGKVLSRTPAGRVVGVVEGLLSRRKPRTGVGLAMPLGYAMVATRSA